MPSTGQPSRKSDCEPHQPLAASDQRRQSDSPERGKLGHGRVGGGPRVRVETAPGPRAGDAVLGSGAFHRATARGFTPLTDAAASERRTRAPALRHRLMEAIARTRPNRESAPTTSWPCTWHRGPEHWQVSSPRQSLAGANRPTGRQPAGRPHPGPLGPGWTSNSSPALRRTSPLPT